MLTGWFSEPRTRCEGALADAEGEPTPDAAAARCHSAQHPNKCRFHLQRGTARERKRVAAARGSLGVFLIHLRLYLCAFLCGRLSLREKGGAFSTRIFGRFCAWALCADANSLSLSSRFCRRALSSRWWRGPKNKRVLFSSRLFLFRDTQALADALKVAFETFFSRPAHAGLGKHTQTLSRRKRARPLKGRAPQFAHSYSIKSGRQSRERFRANQRQLRGVRPRACRRLPRGEDRGRRRRHGATASPGQPLLRISPERDRDRDRDRDRTPSSPPPSTHTSPDGDDDDDDARALSRERETSPKS